MSGGAGFLLPPNSCACTHLKTRHSGACTFKNCGCPRVRWSWSLVDVALMLIRPLRGW